MQSVTIWGVKWSSGGLPGDFKALHGSVKLYEASDFHFQQDFPEFQSDYKIVCGFLHFYMEMNTNRDPHILYHYIYPENYWMDFQSILVETFMVN